MTGVVDTLIRLMPQSLRTTLSQSRRSSTDPFGLPVLIPNDLRTLVETVQPYTLCDPLRLSILYGLMLETTVLGDVVECGVYKGGSAAVLATAALDNADKHLWLYDSFQGMPKPGEHDSAESFKWQDKVVGSHALVEEVLQKVGFPNQRYTIRAGLFKDTFQQDLPQQVSLLHVDSDWYDSVMICLQTFYPRIPAGGVVILDDFGCWEGTRLAFYDFCAEKKIYPLVERVGDTQVFWRVEQENTRSTVSKYFRGIYCPTFDKNAAS